MVIWTLLLAVAAPGRVLADDLEPVIRQLGAGDFAAKIETVEHIAATGDARVVPVLEAMLASRLAVRPATGQVMITETRGRVLVLKDPLSLAEIGEASRADIDSGDRQQPSARRSARRAGRADAAQSRLREAPRGRRRRVQDARSDAAALARKGVR